MSPTDPAEPTAPVSPRVPKPTPPSHSELGLAVEPIDVGALSAGSNNIGNVATARPPLALVTKDAIYVKGVRDERPAIIVGSTKLIITGNRLRTAALSPGRSEWLEDIPDPEAIIRALKSAPTKIDLFRFWQRVPDTQPRFSYFHELKDVAALPITTWDSWWSHQINGKTRNMVRKAEKAGVRCEEVSLNDEFVRGVMGIYNDAPVRRGKRFWHYGKDFETVKSELSRDPDASMFIGAYSGEELIGFTKLLHEGKTAMITMMLDKVTARDRATMNVMISKAVACCASRGIAHLTYTLWRRGDHGAFQARNGFLQIPVPEYYVPLSTKGRLMLLLHLHHGIRGWIPETMMIWLLELRAKWYAWRYHTKAFKVSKT